MTELMPAIEAEMIRQSVSDYLATTFALTDERANSALQDFLSDPVHGMFKGPFLKTRLPFKPSSPESANVLEWQTGFTPYGHQSAAFQRLSSTRDGVEARPLPTLVTTGTGSGKTEAFLYPILDHVIRANRQGKQGIKALILYPMNALANDQSQRIAELITSDPRLAGIRAAIYTGQDSKKRTVVSEDGLINDRYAIRDNPPDILLTNYKMLDQLLLRAEDQTLWRASADSLQYLVLDEFHTYGGAQGTDVAMLIRRLGMAIDHYRTDEPSRPDGAHMVSEDGFGPANSSAMNSGELAGIQPKEIAGSTATPTAAERDVRPLGKITPVATSATLGDGDTAAMRGFAQTVFGERFDEDSVIGETRLSLDEWVGGAEGFARDLGFVPLRTADVEVDAYAKALADLGDRPDPEDLLRITFGQLFRWEPKVDIPGGVDTGDSGLGSVSDADGSASGSGGRRGGLDTSDGRARSIEAFAMVDGGDDRYNDKPESSTDVVWNRISGDIVVQAQLLKASPIVQRLIKESQSAVSIPELPELFLPPSKTLGRSWVHKRARWDSFFRGLISTLGHVRAVAGREFVSVEVHYWLRELSRIDRTAESEPNFSWTDDGVRQQVTGGSSEDAEDVRRRFPAIYCRRCGRSGWSVKMNPLGEDHALPDANIRKDKMAGNARVRSVIHAPKEGDQARSQNIDTSGLRWWDIRNQRFIPSMTEDEAQDYQDGWVLPVLINDGVDATKDDKADKCPSCGSADSIRYLGSRIATLVSVSLSTLFAAQGLSDEEKRALVFSDSVQDAAHRAGFIQSRAHTLTLRAILAEALGSDETTLDALVSKLLTDAANDPVRKYRMLPPDVAERESFRRFWDPKAGRSNPKTNANVRRLLLFLTELEFGAYSTVGRTLELTGTISAHVDAGEESLLNSIAERAIGKAGQQQSLRDVPEEEARRNRVAWVRGILEHIRTSGGINHDWLEKYQQSDGNRWLLWGGRKRNEGMPAFPKGRTVPTFPRVGGGKVKGELDPVTSPRSWYSTWTAKNIGVPSADGGRLAAALLEALEAEGILASRRSDSGASVYSISSSSVVVKGTVIEDLHQGKVMLECNICSTLVPGSVETVSQMEGAPCVSARCRGYLVRKEMDDGFYRRMYDSSSMRRLVAREHTGLLEDKVRQEYEDKFKSSSTDPSAPNVLVATPTLEMGIDIGALSVVYLSSLPNTVASYLQRVGRAGRLNGNSLAVTYAQGRRAQLPRVLDPLSVIEGEVVPPSTYLSAEEILRRQYTASIVDSFARDPKAPHPRRVREAMGTTDDSLLVQVSKVAEEKGLLLKDFSAHFVGINQESLDKLDEWISPVDGPGSSQLAKHLARGSQRWRTELEQLDHRITHLEKDVIPELEEAAESAARTDEDERVLRSAKASLKMSKKRRADLNGDYWISALEQFGLLPNYTLLDDSTILTVGVSQRNPDSGAYEAEALDLSRGSPMALEEFAPGATFYAKGLEIKVDAVDLGIDGQDVTTWALCADCGFGQEIGGLGGVTPKECPYCGSPSLGDMGQRVDLLELSRATAEVNRDDASISDHEDERTRKGFDVVTTVDLDFEKCLKKWSVEGSEMGVGYFEDMTVRKINLGQKGRGQTLQVAGDMADRSLFTVCEGCGKDQDRRDEVSRFKHRPWCKYRNDLDPHDRRIALTHTLNTQGLVLYLPLSVSLADSYAVPSLIAALRLGLSRVLGGDPAHLNFLTATVADPSGSGARDALVIHDQIPGGTGYLTDWSTPENLYRVLTQAWEVVSSCGCHLDDRISCENCLLPYASRGSEDRVSRVAAERYLEILLGMDIDDLNDVPDFSLWAVKEGEVPRADPGESALELTFRQVLKKRLEAISATVTETVELNQTKWTITLPGGKRRWTLQPQVLMGETRPDFFLASDDSNIPKVAIYTDGYAFHAAGGKMNRLSDDAKKRQALRELGDIGVLAVTMRDVEDAQARITEEPFVPLSDRKRLMENPEFRSSPQAFDRQGINPIDWIVQWVQDPEIEEIRKAARGVPLAFGNRPRRESQLPDEQLIEVATRALTASVSGGESPQASSRLPEATSRDTVYCLVVGGNSMALKESPSRFLEAALVIDDRQEAGVDSATWREWLRISNALIFRDWPTEISTVREVEELRRLKAAKPGQAGLDAKAELDGKAAESPTWLSDGPTPFSDATVPSSSLAASSDSGLSGVSPLPSPIPPQWQKLFDEAIDDEHDALEALVKIDLGMIPELGYETVDGIPVPIAWSDTKVGISLVSLDENDREMLESEGWRFVDIDDPNLDCKLKEAGIR